MSKYCIDCVHFLPSWDFDPSECARPLTDEMDVVSGKPKRRLLVSAHRERKSDRTLFGRQRCGPNGRFFQEKPGR